MSPDCWAVALCVTHLRKQYTHLPRLNIDTLKVLMQLRVEFN
jgi:hypothetical protein